MTMVAKLASAVVGVDTHRDAHQAEIAQPSGAPIATRSIRNTEAGYAELIAWASEHAPGERIVFSIEGTGSYGAALTRAVTRAGFPVFECAPPERKQRRRTGKSDPIDAHRAVTSALEEPVEKLATPRADGDREALRILLTAREELTTTVTAQTNRLKALLRGGDDRDRALARKKLSETTLTNLIRRRQPPEAGHMQAVRIDENRRLAHSLRATRRELTSNKARLKQIVDELAPGLTKERGIGPVTAAQAIVSFSHPGRCRSDAAFAKLAGTSPLEASSGQTKRYRLNRSGDRKLNSALHMITVTRMRHCPDTKAYVARRIADGKTEREARRCVKRYITRWLYRFLTKTMPRPA
jgi:transposase